MTQEILHPGPHIVGLYTRDGMRWLTARRKLRTSKDERDAFKFTSRRRAARATSRCKNKQTTLVPVGHTQ